MEKTRNVDISRNEEHTKKKQKGNVQRESREEMRQAKTKRSVRKCLGGDKGRVIEGPDNSALKHDRLCPRLVLPRPDGDLRADGARGRPPLRSDGRHT